jgi:hypothetical protein
MGVDQYTSSHQFDDLPEGGRIELQRDSTDTAGVRTIRDHLRHIALAFREGRLQPSRFRARRNGARYCGDDRKPGTDYL